MNMRGKILREPNAGPGLLMIDGQQFKFTLEGVWKSDVAPRAGLTVEVEIAPDRQITGITVVPESQLAKEQAEVAMAKAKEKGTQLMGQAVAKFGARDLIALGLLAVGWFFLNTVEIAAPGLGKLSFTFWQILGFVNAGNLLEVMARGPHPSAGFYGFLALVALAGPFVHHFWKDKRAALAGVVPLLFMLIVWMTARSNFQSALGGNAAGDMGEFGKQMQAEVSQAISLGFGAYLSGLASLYFALMAVKKYMAPQPIAVEEPAKHKQAAA
jgi:hypothetical protein